MAHEPTEQEWREIAKQAHRDQDSKRLTELTQQLGEKRKEETARDKPSK